MDPNSRAHISEAQEGIHQSTDPPAFRPGKAYHHPDKCKLLPNRWHFQPERWFRHSQNCRLLLVKILPCQNKVRHVWSGALNHRGNSQAMARKSRGSQSQDLSRRKKVRRYLGNIEERYGRCGRNCVTEKRRRWKTRRKRRDGGGII